MLRTQILALTLPSCCGGVLDYIHAPSADSLFSPRFSLFFHCTFGQHLCSHSSSINSVCWGSSPPPPSFFCPPPPPPFYPVSQLMLVSVIDHIWDRLDCSRSVCKKCGQKAGGDLACSEDIPLGWTQGDPYPLPNACSQDGLMNAFLFLVTSLPVGVFDFWADP